MSAGGAPQDGSAGGDRDAISPLDAVPVGFGSNDYLHDATSIDAAVCPVN